MALHYALKHLDIARSYVPFLFVDCSSAFNIILPNIPDHQLTLLEVSRAHQEVVQGSTNQQIPVVEAISSSVSFDSSVKLFKFADETNLVGLISRGHESAYGGTIDSNRAGGHYTALSLMLTKQ